MMTENQIPTVQLFSPHVGQKKVWDTIMNQWNQYVVLACGRRWGKTELSINLMLYWALSGPNYEILYVTYSGKQQANVYNDLVHTKKLIEAPFVKKCDGANREIIFTNGSIIRFRLGRNPGIEEIRGSHADKMILDEFALFPEGAWDAVLSSVPANAAESVRKVIFMSTPRGRGKFYELYQYGLDPTNKNWKSFNLPTSSNPLISRQFLAQTKKQINKKAWTQEFEAQFIDDAGTVFENVNQCAHPLSNKPAVAAGIDLGIKNDYTVIWLLDENNNCVAYDRFNEVTLDQAATRLTNILRKHKWPKCFIEDNQYQGVFDMMLQKGCSNLHTYMTTTSSKSKAINHLINLFEQQQIGIPKEEYIINEFLSFNYYYNPKTRKVSYSAPNGMHDDCVMACAIATQAAEKSDISISFI